MLSILTKKLCPLMSLALAFGCGKKINDPDTTSGNNRAEQGYELPPVITVQLDETVSPVKLYTLPRNAWFKLPSKLLATTGNAIGNKVKIYYGVLSNGYFEFYCSYSSASSATELAIDKCESNYGLAVSPDSQFPMDKASSIKMQLTNPSGTGMKIDSTYHVDWK
jgi:hypothetical protein